MKKSLMAICVISAFWASFPLVEVLAATSGRFVDDEVTITIAKSCNITRVGGSATITNTMLNLNDLNANFGSNTYNVICNNSEGFTVNAAFTPLEMKVNNVTKATINYSATTPVAGSGTWTAYTSFGDGGNMAATDGVLMSSNTTTDNVNGMTATVTYKVSTADNQAHGNYTGTATYTLNQNS